MTNRVLLTRLLTWELTTRTLIIGLLIRRIIPTKFAAVRTRSPLPLLRPHLQMRMVLPLQALCVRVLASFIELTLGLEQAICGTLSLWTGWGVRLLRSLVRQTFRRKLWRVSRRFGATLLMVHMLGMPAVRWLLIRI